MLTINDFWFFITNFGNIDYWTFFSIFLVIFYLYLKRKDKKKFAWIIFVLIPAIFLSNQVTSILKDFFKIDRPCFGQISCPNSYSFPSGHATVIFAAMFSILLNIKNNRLKIPLFAFAVLVAISRVALNLHTYFDIFAGALIGIAFSYAFTYIFNEYVR